MNEKSIGTEQGGQPAERARNERQSEVADSVEVVNLIALMRLMWQQKLQIAVITAFFAAASIAYALLATEWYEAEVLLTSTDDESMQDIAGQFGGLASLAGIELGSGGTAEPIAVLRSRAFSRDFIEDLDLMPVLFAEEWDAESGRWRSENTDDQPEMRDAVRLFREDLLSVREDSQTGLVTVTVEWKDPQVAADWANTLVERLNARMRQRALRDAENNVEYLQNELKGVAVVAIQQSIGRLLETELQKLMLAKGNEEFAFRVIDPATPPKYRSRPKRTLLVVASTFFGGMIGVFFVVMRRMWRQQAN